MILLSDEFNKILKTDYPIHMSEEQIEKHKNQNIVIIVKKNLN